MNVDRAPPVHTSTPPLAVTSSSTEVPPIPGQPDQPRTNEQPLSLTAPTPPAPAGTGQQQRRSGPSNTLGQEIPQMLGEMREVISNLAVSVNSLKDAVSDLRAGQSTPGSSGSAPVRGSGRGRGPRRGRGRGRNEATGGPAGDVADDEGQGDGDDGEGKDYKLRVSVVTHVRQLPD